MQILTYLTLSAATSLEQAKSQTIQFILYSRLPNRYYSLQVVKLFFNRILDLFHYYNILLFFLEHKEFFPNEILLLKEASYITSIFLLPQSTHINTHTHSCVYDLIQIHSAYKRQDNLGQVQNYAVYVWFHFRFLLLQRPKYSLVGQLVFFSSKNLLLQNLYQRLMINS